MNNQYVSSFTSKYYDVDNVKTDVKIINEILGRQGSVLLVDCIANLAGETSVKHKLNSVERNRLIDSLLLQLKESLEERL